MLHYVTKLIFILVVSLSYTSSNTCAQPLNAYGHCLQGCENKRTNCLGSANPDDPTNPQVTKCGMAKVHCDKECAQVAPPPPRPDLEHR